jgi:hypothetical protein
MTIDGTPIRPQRALLEVLGLLTGLWRMMYLLCCSSATILEDGVQVGLAVVESGLEVVHLLVQTFHILLDGLLIFRQAHLDIGLWAGDEPRKYMSETVFSRLLLCELTSFLHPRRHWRRMADRRVRQR